MSDSDEDETHCPLCVEELDLSDKNFQPCPCGYRVCMWCWHHIRENLNGLCPACRTPYNADPHAFSAIDRQDVVKKNREKKQKEKQEKKTTESSIIRQPGSIPSKATTAPTVVDRKHLHNFRVIQRNLVYVIGVPATFNSEEMLRKAEYFGQYGKIGKMVMHRNNTSSHTLVSAYVTFTYKEDAKAAIQALDGFWLEGHVFRASFGTTKYCNNFIRGVLCNNPDCVYLHELGDDDDRFTKEEIQAGQSKLAQVPGKDQSIVTGNGGPSGTGKRPSCEPVFPPPVFIQDNPGTLTTVAKSQPISRSSSSTWSSGTVSNGSANLADTAGVKGLSALVAEDNNSSSNNGIHGKGSINSIVNTPASKGQQTIAAVINNSSNNSSSNNSSNSSSNGGTGTGVANGTEERKSQLNKHSAVTMAEANKAVDLPVGRNKRVASSASDSSNSSTNTSTLTLVNSEGAPTAASKNKSNNVTAIGDNSNDSSKSKSETIQNAGNSNANRKQQQHNNSNIPARHTPELKATPAAPPSPSPAPLEAPSSTAINTSTTSTTNTTNNTTNTSTTSDSNPFHSSSPLRGVLPTSQSSLALPSQTGSQNISSSGHYKSQARNSTSPPVLLFSFIYSQPGSTSNIAHAGSNGLSKNAVFPVPHSSLSITVWSTILQSTGDADLVQNPFSKFYVPFSELLDLTLPPLDAMTINPWPRPQAYYQQTQAQGQGQGQGQSPVQAQTMGQIQGQQLLGHIQHGRGAPLPSGQGSASTGAGAGSARPPMNKDSRHFLQQRGVGR